MVSKFFASYFYACCGYDDNNGQGDRHSLRHSSNLSEFRPRDYSFVAVPVNLPGSFKNSIEIDYGSKTKTRDREEVKLNDFVPRTSNSENIRDSIVSECPDPDIEIWSSVEGDDRISQARLSNRPNLVAESNPLTPGNRINDCNTKQSEKSEQMSDMPRADSVGIEIPS